MFILRRITSEQQQANSIIGREYSVVTEEENKEIFEKTLEIQNQVQNKEFIYGFIIYNYGQEVEPLFKKSRYYIMTENGATFANISHK